MNLSKPFLSFTLLANEASPIENFCLVIKNWNLKRKASLSVDGNYVKTKQGIVSDTDGSLKLIIWIEKSSSATFNVEIKTI